MRLHKAIIKGSKIRKQVFGALYRQAMGEEIGSCALGAAMEAINPRAITGKYEIAEAWDHIRGIAYHQTTFCCEHISEVERTHVKDVVVHLNDVHKWSREAIAEWVKTIEDAVTREKWAKRAEKRQKQALEARLPDSEVFLPQTVFMATRN